MSRPLVNLEHASRGRGSSAHAEMIPQCLERRISRQTTAVEGRLLVCNFPGQGPRPMITGVMITPSRGVTFFMNSGMMHWC